MNVNVNVFMFCFTKGDDDPNKGDVGKDIDGEIGDVEAREGMFP